MVSTSRYGRPSTFEMTSKAGIEKVLDSTAARNGSSAGSISSLCHAPETLSGTTRLAPASSIACAAACTASKSPLMTICVGELKFASATRPPSRTRASSITLRTSSASRPRIADMPPRRAPLPPASPCLAR